MEQLTDITDIIKDAFGSSTEVKAKVKTGLNTVTELIKWFLKTPAKDIKNGEVSTWQLIGGKTPHILSKQAQHLNKIIAIKTSCNKKEYVLWEETFNNYLDTMETGGLADLKLQDYKKYNIIFVPLNKFSGASCIDKTDSKNQVEDISLLDVRESLVQQYIDNGKRIHIYDYIVKINGFIYVNVFDTTAAAGYGKCITYKYDSHTNAITSFDKFEKETAHKNIAWDFDKIGPYIFELKHDDLLFNELKKLPEFNQFDYDDIIEIIDVGGFKSYARELETQKLNSDFVALDKSLQNRINQVWDKKQKVVKAKLASYKDNEVTLNEFNSRIKGSARYFGFARGVIKVGITAANITNDLECDAYKIQKIKGKNSLFIRGGVKYDKTTYYFDNWAQLVNGTLITKKENENG
ncbi:hypothetical protein ACFLQL_01620 [Verrucomicrobiota bacterium]